MNEIQQFLLERKNIKHNKKYLKDKGYSLTKDMMINNDIRFKVENKVTGRSILIFDYELKFHPSNFKRIISNR